MLDVDFYQKITTHDTKKAIEFVDSNDTFCRMEQLGTNQEGFANLNRIQIIGQHSSSIYSSVYNEAYQKFLYTMKRIRNFVQKLLNWKKLTGIF